MADYRQKYKLTPISIDSITKHWSYEKVNHLKSRLPGLRHVSSNFKSVTIFQKKEGFEIEIDQNLEFRIVDSKEIKDQRTKIHKNLNASEIQATRRDFPPRFSRFSAEEVLEKFVNIVLDRDGNSIYELFVSEHDQIFGYFKKQKVEINVIHFKRTIEPVEPQSWKSILNFKNLQSLHFTDPFLSDENMDVITRLEVPELRVTANKFPNNRHFELKSKQLILTEGTNTVEDFFLFVKKLVNENHQQSSGYTVKKFDTPMTQRQSIGEIEEKFPNYIIERPRRHSDSSKTIWVEISEKMELRLKKDWHGFSVFLRDRKENRRQCTKRKMKGRFLQF